ncbi:hypothetical protein OG873_19895 [Streptomyces violaceus]|uniref:helix-turn-helix domain-containing protein n=1 Tax=Streptomyces violaceus TaxID=1936 RepID=UPI002E29605D|nr:hypothetical protein [Streptomyces violaceus]
MSTLPEVAALATELTLIFKSLAMSQQQYAIRANYDKSYVSRFLNGRRVATQDFVDRLLKEVETNRGVPITEQTRARLFNLRTAALRVYDPDLYKLEKVRDEAHRYQREIKRLMLHQEALEGLLERRQAEVNEARKELTQAQSDWITDKVHTEAEILTLKGEGLRYDDERKTLLDEISRLRQELKITIEQRDIAEQRCALLEEQTKAVEIEIAEKREREGIEDVGVPIGFIQDRLERADDVTIYRELVEFASSRASSDVANMALWLYRHGMKDYTTQLVTDYCRQRPVLFSVDLVREAEKQPDVDAADEAYFYLVGAVGSAVRRRSLEDLFEFIERYTVLHRVEKFSPNPAAAIRVASVWLTGRPTAKGRENRFFEVVDFLKSLDEERSASFLIKQQAGHKGVITRFARVIGESGREVDIKVFVDEWLERVMSSGSGSHFQFARQLKVIAKFSNPLMFNMILDGIWETCDLEEIAGIYLYSSGEDSYAFDRLTEVIAERGIGEDIRRILDEKHGVRIQFGESPKKERA